MGLSIYVPSRGSSPGDRERLGVGWRFAIVSRSKVVIIYIGSYKFITPMPFTLADTRSTWLAYTALLTLLGLGFFAGLVDLPLDTHDEDYFLDSADALADYSFFFDADKRKPGRPALELALLLQYLVWGTDVATYHLFGGLLHLCAALALARAGRAMGLDLDLALLTGLLCLVNVSHFNAVHWISAQCYALVLICGCLALV